MSPLSVLTRSLQTLDWDQAAEVEAATADLLASLAEDRETLGAAVRAAAEDPHLRPLCEHYDILDKIVLLNDPSGFRVRLHLFGPDHFDRPHNHRWTYSARVLSGAYTHTVYGTEDDFYENTNVADLQPKMVRIERPGSSYTLHHTMVHAAVAHPNTVSLIVRGPSVKDRFLVSDRDTGRVWWQHGAATESPEEAAAKRMTNALFTDCVNALHKLDLI
jgi:predicted metal-dependent enzyme (double-stranded beta helix superfamily)